MQNIRRYSVYIAWAVSLVATLGSLYYSQVAGLIPCTFCWYQRIAMYPLVLIIGAGILKRDSGVKAYALPLSIAGAAVGVYQVLLQQGWVKDIEACSAIANCAVKRAVLFHSVTIPMMSLLAWILIVTTLAIYKQDPEA
jgi:disulfide bond formation protein DsbB